MGVLAFTEVANKAQFLRQANAVGEALVNNRFAALPSAEPLALCTTN